MEQQDLQSVTESSKKSRGTPEADGNEETAGEAESADRGAESRAETGKHDAEKIWTAEEILADDTGLSTDDKQRIQIGLRDARNNLRKLEAGNRRNG